MMLRAPQPGVLSNLQTFPIAHSPSQIRFHQRKGFTTTFQITDPPLCDFLGFQSQSSMLSSGRYLCLMTLVHRISVLISLHPPFAARAYENRKIFFNPHSPRPLGTTILLHLTHGVTCSTFFPLQRNLKHSLLTFSRMPLGIQDRHIQ